jgi:hypothetical protein
MMIPTRLEHIAAWTLRWRVVLPVIALLFGMYFAFLHPWLLAWGATADEQEMTLAGDDADPAPYVTRAINIGAPPSAVWPWIVQMGQDRGGFYSNTWLENLFGSDIHNAQAIHPEWQQRSLGDVVPLARPDLLFGTGAGGHTDIVLIQPERAIGIIVGRFVLEPTGDNGTRLLFRESLQTQGPPAQGPGVLRAMVWDPAHFVMVHRVLEGIKERAEAQPLVPDGLQTLARFGWLVAGATLLAAFAAHRRWWPWLLLPLLVLAPPFVATHDLDSTLAGFLAIGITIAGAQQFGRTWWPAYVLIAAAVLLVLLLAPDAYAAFGLIFLVGAIVAGIALAPRMLAAPREQPRQPAAVVRR